MRGSRQLSTFRNDRERKRERKRGREREKERERERGKVAAVVEKGLECAVGVRL